LLKTSLKLRPNLGLKQASFKTLFRVTFTAPFSPVFEWLFLAEMDLIVDRVNQ